MIETAADAVIFALFLMASLLVGAAVFRKLVEKCAGALRGWLG